MAQTNSASPAAQLHHPIVGVRSRVAGSGQEYEVVGMADPSTALISIVTWDEPLPYPVAEVEMDLAGDCTKERFQPLVGQYRTIGPAGPTYEVIDIVDAKTARIWIVAEDDDEEYRIEDVLIDPIHAD